MAYLSWIFFRLDKLALKMILMVSEENVSFIWWNALTF